jgi:hypothetical protein
MTFDFVRNGPVTVLGRARAALPYGSGSRSKSKGRCSITNARNREQSRFSVCRTIVVQLLA